MHKFCENSAKRGVSKRILLMLVTSVFTLSQFSDVFAASSGSYQLDGSQALQESSLSSSFSLCSRIGSVGANGSSSSFNVQPGLSCGTVVPPPVVVGGGGSRYHYCGNGTMEFTETCDDGNTLNGDGCSNVCQVEETTPVTPENPEQPQPEQPQPQDPEEPQVPEEEPVQPEDPEEPVKTPENPRQPIDVIHTDPEVNIPGFIPGILLPQCGNRVQEFGEECDDGNSFNADGCSSVCKRESLLFEQPFRAPVSGQLTRLRPSAPVFNGDVYLTNDISVLFFEQFPGSEGDFDIELRDAKRSYDIEVEQTIDGYFSFLLKEELPDGLYQITIRDKKNPALVREMILEVRKNEVIQSPNLSTLDGVEISEDEEMVVTSLSPVLRGSTVLPATIALYSSQLQKTFIVYTDEQNEFEFRYPEKLVAGVSETLSIVAHYENGYVSKPQILRLKISDPLHFGADENLVVNSPIFSFLGIVLLFVISTVSSLFLFGFVSPTSFNIRRTVLSNKVPRNS